MPDWHRADTNTLRKAILDIDGLMPLILADPDKAADLLLAAVLQRHGSGDWGGLQINIGIVNSLDRRAPLPENGPLMAFLITAPEQALDVILKMVDHATQGWRQSELAQYSSDPVGETFEIILDGTPVALGGNSDVMHWHRGD